VKILFCVCMYGSVCAQACCTEHNNTKHNRKNIPLLRDILAHRRDHIQKDWRYENGSTAVSIKRQFQHLMMTITYRNMKCDVMWINFQWGITFKRFIEDSLHVRQFNQLRSLIRDAQQDTRM
jgi:hypothetical protein